MSEQESLHVELKKLIVETLALEDTTPEEIETDAPLFGEGLGLDSIDALDRNLTILIVAHRLTTVQRCDTIVEIEGSRIAAQGTYDRFTPELGADLIESVRNTA